MARAFTTIEVNKRLAPRGLSLVGQWLGTGKVNEFKCSSDHNWTTKGTNVISMGAGCPICYQSNRIVLTTQEVNNKLAVRGLKLNEDWKGTTKHHSFACNLGHTWSAIGTNVLNAGNGCPTCFFQSQWAFTEDEVKTKLAHRGIKLLSKWSHSKKKYRFACERGHTWTTTGASVLYLETGCAKCACEDQYLNFNEIEARLSTKKLKLVGKWNGLHKQNHFMCSEGHEWQTTGSSPVSAGHGCPKCEGIEKLTEAQVNARLETQSLKLVGEWRGMINLNRFRCSVGHEWEATGSGPVNAGTGCPECHGRLKSRMTEPEVNERLASKGFSLIGTWKGGHKSNRFKCSLGHEWNTTGAGPVHTNNGCPECWRLNMKNQHARIF